MPEDFWRSTQNLAQVKNLVDELSNKDEELNEKVTEPSEAETALRPLRKDVINKMIEPLEAMRSANTRFWAQCVLLTQQDPRSGRLIPRPPGASLTVNDIRDTFIAYHHGFDALNKGLGEMTDAHAQVLGESHPHTALLRSTATKLVGMQEDHKSIINSAGMNWEEMLANRYGQNGNLGRQFE
jgi:hypothetical protein